MVIGYGGFDISITPFFSPTLMTVLQRYHGLRAVPNIRGGGEFGEDWHLAGTREKKVRQLMILWGVPNILRRPTLPAD